jgi:hypothetical protein
MFSLTYFLFGFATANSLALLSSDGNASTIMQNSTEFLQQALPATSLAQSLSQDQKDIVKQFFESLKNKGEVMNIEEIIEEMRTHQDPVPTAPKSDQQQSKPVHQKTSSVTKGDPLALSVISWLPAYIIVFGIANYGLWYLWFLEDLDLSEAGPDNEDKVMVILSVMAIVMVIYATSSIFSIVLAVLWLLSNCSDRFSPREDDFWLNFMRKWMKFTAMLPYVLRCFAP